MWTDLRIALRNCRRRPVYCLTCMGVLAFGIGSCIAVFSALYAAVLKPLPYPEPARLIRIENRFPSVHMEHMGASPADYRLLAEHRELFAGIGVYYFLDLSLSGVELPQKVNAVAVTESLFRTLGVQPEMGRLFTPAEERVGGPHAVVLSDAWWRGAMNGDPQVLHRTLRLNGEPYRIVGVMPNSFAFPNDVTQMWTPLAIRNIADSRNYYLRTVARLAPGLNVAGGERRLAELSRTVAARSPELHAVAPRGWSYTLRPLLRNDNVSLRRWLWILCAAVCCFLLIACSNVAALVLVRSSERRFELAVRMALGAGKARIARQVLAEVLVLAAGGGIAGIGFGRAGIALLARYGPAGPLEFVGPVFWFAAGLTAITAMVCGLYPALRAAGLACREQSHRFTAPTGTKRFQKVLTIGQVAMATALLLCGGLLVHSVLKLLRTPLGFNPERVLTLQVSLPPRRYATPESRARFYDSLLARIAALPEVQSASGCTLLPFGYGENVNTFEVVGRPRQPLAQMADLNTVSPGYFQTLRIPLLRGRLFSARDGAGAPPVVVIDKTLAQRFFEGQDPVGQTLRMPWGEFTIAGVVGSVKTSGIDTDPPPTIYFAIDQGPVTDLTLAIRSRSAESAMLAQVQHAVTSLDRDQPVYDVATLQSRIDRSMQARRFVAALLLVFAASGCLLAAIGLYGLLSYLVTLRRREIAIRMAVGATNARIARMVCFAGMTMVASGIVLGAAAALGASKFIAGEIYGVGVRDPLTWAIVPTVVAFTGVLASAAPAWRAAKQNAANALRSE